jgi:hypothetical protein
LGERDWRVAKLGYCLVADDTESKLNRFNSPDKGRWIVRWRVGKRACPAAGILYTCYSGTEGQASPHLILLTGPRDRGTQGSGGGCRFVTGDAERSVAEFEIPDKSRRLRGGEQEGPGRWLQACCR